MIIKMILTNGFDPDPRVYKEARTLVENGHDVEVLCWDRESRYKEKEFEIIDGVKIKRFYSKGLYGSGYKQIFGFLNFGKVVKNYINNNYCDAIHCHDFDGFYIGNKIKKNNPNIKMIFDEHDFFYLYFKNRKGFINNLISQLIIFLQKRMLKNVDSHIVVTPKAKECYKNKEKITIITNAPMKQNFKNITKKRHKEITVGFIGTVRYYEELKSLISVGSNYEHIKILIAGKGIVLNKLSYLIKNTGCTNVELLGEYKLNQLEELYSKIDITYLIYPSQDSKVSLPNKFFESIISETPIIADQESEYGQIVKQCRLGWIIDSNNLEESIKNVFDEINSNLELLDSYKENMKKIKDQYYWESNIDNLCAIYK